MDQTLAQGVALAIGGRTTEGALDVAHEGNQGAFAPTFGAAFAATAAFEFFHKRQ